MAFKVREILCDESKIINVGVKVLLVTGVVERSWFAQDRCPASLFEKFHIDVFQMWCFHGAGTDLAVIL